jgi:hypothetical protein
LLQTHRPTLCPGCGELCWVEPLLHHGNSFVVRPALSAVEWLAHRFKEHLRRSEEPRYLGRTARLRERDCQILDADLCTANVLQRLQEHQALAEERHDLFALASATVQTCQVTLGVGDDMAVTACSRL